MKLGVLLALVLTCVSTASGQSADTVGPDRPSFSSSAHIVPAGHIQIEAGMGQSRFGASSGYDLGELLLRVGLSSHAEVRVAIPSYLESQSGGVRQAAFDDLSLGGKFYVKTKDRLAIGFLTSVQLPTGSREVAEHTVQPGAAFISDLTVSKIVTVTSNVGYTRATNAGQRYNYTFAVSTINIALSSSVGMFTEFYLFHQQSGPVQKYAASGFAWTVAKRTAFDISGGVGLPSNGAHGPDRYFSIGLSRLF